jgi:hypothetical protein
MSAPDPFALGGWSGRTASDELVDRAGPISVDAIAHQDDDERARAVFRRWLAQGDVLDGFDKDDESDAWSAACDLFAAIEDEIAPLGGQSLLRSRRYSTYAAADTR